MVIWKICASLRCRWPGLVQQARLLSPFGRSCFVRSCSVLCWKYCRTGFGPAGAGAHRQRPSMGALTGPLRRSCAFGFLYLSTRSRQLILRRGLGLCNRRTLHCLSIRALGISVGPGPWLLESWVSQHGTSSQRSCCKQRPDCVEQKILSGMATSCPGFCVMVSQEPTHSKT